VGFDPGFNTEENKADTICKGVSNRWRVIKKKEHVTEREEGEREAASENNVECPLRRGVRLGVEKGTTFGGRKSQKKKGGIDHKPLEKRDKGTGSQ